jgi:hypothetical protein
MIVMAAAPNRSVSAGRTPAPAANAVNHEEHRMPSDPEIVTAAFAARANGARYVTSILADDMTPEIAGRPVGAAVRSGTGPGAGPGSGEDAMEALFTDAYPRLAGWVRRLVDDDDTAHDIASEAFVRLLARWTRVPSPQQYLYTIATGLVRDHRRKVKRERRP